MPMRPLKLPQDAKPLPDLLVPAFQDPEHPQWGVHADEAESVADQLREVRRLWPLLAPLRLVSTTARPELAAPLLGYIAFQVARRSPGRRLEAQIAGWQHALLTAARVVGLREKLRGYEMGLRLESASHVAGSPLASARERDRG